jgi:hypothetical protein
MAKHLDKRLQTHTRARSKSTHKGLLRRSRAAKADWSPERRARQAELIRSLQTWKKSTGPRTDSGKARCAANALKHGCRSRAHIEAKRAERQLLRDSAHTIALAKLVLGSRFARSRGVLLRTLSAPWACPADLSAEARRAKAEARSAKADHELAQGAEPATPGPALV